MKSSGRLLGTQDETLPSTEEDEFLAQLSGRQLSKWDSAS
jgi:hypothetical protein